MRPTNPLDILHVLGGDYSSPEPTVAPLRLTNVGAEDAEIWFSYSFYESELDLRYRKNEQGSYERFPTYDNRITLQTGDYVDVIGDNTSFGHNSNIGTFIIRSPYRIEASGSVMSLIYGENLDEENNLIIPNGIGHILQYLFSNCTGIITPPELPATQLQGGSYQYMFDGCSNLSYAPDLPAETLTYGCYECMFRACTSITQPPVIAGKEYITRCCYLMFLGCSSLLIAPDIPETLFTESAQYMFNGCSSLQEIRVNFTTWSYATYAWLGGVAANGTFKCPAALDTSTRDSSHIPAGWTIETF